jgi:hypothetical protein
MSAKKVLPAKATKTLALPPATGRKEPRSVTISFQITPSLKAALMAAAETEQRSISQVVAMRLDEAMKSEGYLK